MKRRRQTQENEENEDTKRERKTQENEESENEESEGEEDRLSDFPDCILLHILSFLNAKEAVQTCILSTRWKHLWKHLSTITLTSNDFKKNLKGYTKFVSRILSLRDSSIALEALTFHRRGSVEPNLLKRIVRYALSHNVHRLGLNCQFKDIQLSSFSSLTLKNLTLVYPKELVVVFPNNLNLPALTKLHLWRLVFRANENGRADPFSGFRKLNTLIIDFYVVLDGKTLCISNTTLVDLYLNPIPSKVDGNYPKPKIDLYAPKLCIFSFHGTLFPNLHGSSFSSLKHLNIDSYGGYDNHFMLHNWLTELAHIKSLTVSVRTLKFLFSGPHKLKVKLPSLCNLKILKVEIKPPWDSHGLDKMVDSHCLDKMVDLLRQNAPLAEVRIEKEIKESRILRRPLLYMSRMDLVVP